MDVEIKALIEYYNLEKLPVEGTLYKSSYRSQLKYKDGPLSSAIIGMYCNTPLSISRFHKLDYDEVWHFYGGDPFILHLLLPDGKYKLIKMGNNFQEDQHIQFVVPAGVWQAGELQAGGKYALYGCTMAPGFMSSCFEAGETEKLLKLYPESAAIIERLGSPEEESEMPAGFDY